MRALIGLRVRLSVVGTVLVLASGACAQTPPPQSGKPSFDPAFVKEQQRRIAAFDSVVRVVNTDSAYKLWHVILTSELAAQRGVQGPGAIPGVPNPYAAGYPTYAPAPVVSPPPVRSPRAAAYAAALEAPVVASAPVHGAGGGGHPGGARHGDQQRPAGRHPRPGLPRRVRLGDPAHPPPEGPPVHGAIVMTCLPERVARFALERGYVWRGDCPGGAVPLGKVVVGIAGDTITLDTAGIALNGRRVPNNRPRDHDTQGRQLQPYMYGTRVLAPGELWLFSPHHPLSFDSRYFGPVLTDNVLSPLVPGWTSAPLH